MYRRYLLTHWLAEQYLYSNQHSTLATNYKLVYVTLTVF